MSRVAAPPPTASDPLNPAPAPVPSDGEVARLAGALADLGVAATTAAPLVVAVSGGPDSMALLGMVAAACPGAIVAATVDHRLRAESAVEAALVADWCAHAGVPHRTLVPSDPITGASLQARARDLRYHLLAGEAARLGATVIATAHHADDAAETFLMRAARGSGLAGLAGIRPRTTIHGVAVVRPLLDWRRAELRAIVRRARMPFVDDPANEDDRHDRTRFRRLLEDNEWLDPPHLAQAAAALASLDADLAALVERDWAAAARIDGTAVGFDVVERPREVQRRLLRRAIGTVRAAAGIEQPPWSDAANVEPLLDRLARGRRATQAGVVVTPRAGQWRVAPAPPRRMR